MTIGDLLTSDYQVQITATINNPVTSDISIDDIQTTPGICNSTGQPTKGVLDVPNSIKYRAVCWRG